MGSESGDGRTAGTQPSSVQGLVEGSTFGVAQNQRRGGEQTGRDD